MIRLLQSAGATRGPWRYGGVYDAGNTLAYRTTDQKRLMQVPDPIGPDNDAHLIKMAKEAAVIFVYGQPCHKTFQAPSLALARLPMKEAGVVPHTLRLAKNGTPWHPLYLPETL